MAQVSPERHDGDTAEQPSSASYRFRPGPCPGGPVGPSWDGQTLTARPQQHKREVQQSREQVLHPHGGRTAGKVGRRLCSGPTRFEWASAHPLSWQLPANSSLPSTTAPSPAWLRDPQHPREGIGLSVSLSAQTPPRTSFPHSLSLSRHTELPPPWGIPPPPNTRGTTNLSSHRASTSLPTPSSAAQCTLGLVVPAVPPSGGTVQRGHPTL